MTPAPTVLGSGTIYDVAQQRLPPDGHMPEGTYPTEVDTFNFVELPDSQSIKEILSAARADGRLDLSEELISRLRIGIDDE